MTKKIQNLFFYMLSSILNFWQKNVAIYLILQKRCCVTLINSYTYILRFSLFNNMRNKFLNPQVTMQAAQ